MSSEISKGWWDDWQGALLTAKARGIGPRGMEWLTNKAREDWQETVETVRETRNSLGGTVAVRIFAAWRKWHPQYARDQVNAWSSELPTTIDLAQARVAAVNRQSAQIHLLKRREALQGRIVRVLKDAPGALTRFQVETAVFPAPKAHKGRAAVWAVIETMAAENLVAMVPMIDKSTTGNVARGVVLCNVKHYEPSL